MIQLLGVNPTVPATSLSTLPTTANATRVMCPTPTEWDADSNALLATTTTTLSLSASPTVGPMLMLTQLTDVFVTQDTY